jgi:hypothetical protein
MRKRGAVEILAPYFTLIDGDTSVEQRLNGITVDLRVRILKTNPNAINLRQSE